MTMKRIAVLGAGTMGHGIAQVSAAAFPTVVLYDVDDERVQGGLQRIQANLNKGVDRGKVSAEDRDQCLGALEGTSSLERAVSGSDLVIEAAPEDMALKHRIFSEVVRHAPAGALLATNTSSLSISEIAADLPDPGRFIGLHFFNPVHIMALVEVVKGEATTPDTLSEALSYVAAIGKEPVVVRDSPGFASSRLGIALGLEAMRMVEEGVASPEDIDKAMELGYRHPMGPLRLTDLVGLDVRLGIAEYLHGALGSEAFRPPDILRRLVADGRLGKKSGHGFYDWSDD